MLESLGHERRLGNSMTINLELEDAPRPSDCSSSCPMAGATSSASWTCPGARTGEPAPTGTDPVDVQLSEPPGRVASKPAAAEHALRSNSLKRAYAGSNPTPDRTPELGVLDNSGSASVKERLTPRPFLAVELGTCGRRSCRRTDSKLRSTPLEADSGWSELRRVA